MVQNTLPQPLTQTFYVRHSRRDRKEEGSLQLLSHQTTWTTDFSPPYLSRLTHTHTLQTPKFPKSRKATKLNLEKVPKDSNPSVVYGCETIKMYTILICITMSRNSANKNKKLFAQNKSERFNLNFDVKKLFFFLQQTL